MEIPRPRNLSTLLSRTRNMHDVLNKVPSWLYFVLWFIISCPERQILRLLYFVIWCIIPCPVWQILRTFWSVLYHAFISGSIAVYALFKSVYDFGPVHRRRSLVEILKNPVPSYNEYYYRYKSFNRVERGRRWSRRKFLVKSNPNVVPRRVIRDRNVLSEDDFARSQREFRLDQYKCPHSKITPISAKHHVFSVYTNPHASSMGFGNTEVTDKMALTYFFAINELPCPSIVFLEMPKKPPDVILSVIIMILFVTGKIISRIQLALRMPHKKSRRRRKRSPEAAARHKSKKVAQRKLSLPPKDIQ